MKHTLPVASAVAVLLRRVGVQRGRRHGRLAALRHSRGDRAPHVVRSRRPGRAAPRTRRSRRRRGGRALGPRGAGRSGQDLRLRRRLPRAGRRFPVAQRARAPRLARRRGRDDAADGVPARRAPRDRTAGPPWPGSYRAPDTAARARLELHLRWTATGEVLWRDAAFEEADAAQAPARDPRRGEPPAARHDVARRTAGSASSGSSRRPPRRAPTSCACPRGSRPPATGSRTRRRPRRCRARAPPSSATWRSGSTSGSWPGSTSGREPGSTTPPS